MARSRLRRVFSGIAAAVVLLVAVVFVFGGQIVDRVANRTLEKPPYSVELEAQKLSMHSFIADLHADALLWNRDLTDRHQHGSVDIPRLIGGRVAIQAFFIVTKTPFGLNIQRNEADTFDMVTPLAVLNHWPVGTWTSLFQRAVHQAERLHQISEQSNGRLMLLRTQKDLERYVEIKKKNPFMTAAIVGIEGAHALEGNLAHVADLHAYGVRIMGLTHFFDNEVGGSAHGVNKSGLTAFGKQVVEAVENQHMIVDLAHASPQLIDDVLAIATRPVIVSHTGVKGTCDNIRNLSDEHIKAIAATGGLIGIGYWDVATCGNDAKAIGKAIQYVGELVGWEHVALGSDFDGAVVVPFDTTGLAKIIDALMALDVRRADIRNVMGQNALRLFQTALPE